MVSFKLKLVAYFVLLTLLPLGAAFWGFGTLAQRSETRRADARLQAGLRAALSAYQGQVLTVGRTASRLANDPDFQAALRDRNRAVLEDFVSTNPNLHVRVGTTLDLGPTPTSAVVRTVAVLSHQQVLGRVILWLPVDRTLLAAVTKGSGLAATDTLVIARNGKVVLGPAKLVGAAVSVRAGQPAVERLGGVRYRILSAVGLEEPRGISFAVLTPQSAIDAAAYRSERTLLLALLGMLVLVGLVAYGLSRSIVGMLSRLAHAAQAIAAGRLGERVHIRGRDEFGQLAGAFNEMAAQLEARMVELESERGRLSRATSRIGEALAATHDVDQLLAVVVETAVEATSAYGAVVRAADGAELARAGDPESGLQTVELPLQVGERSFGTLVLAGPSFGTEERETAASLVAQAAIALENARLHRIVERQALVDGLTGLANRRSCEDVLRAELSRAERFSGELALVMADLDNFKEVNDRFGHPVGDLVLREFARRLRETVREIDLAARWGGEEFCLVLPHTGAAGAVHVAERARAAMEERPIAVPDGTTLQVTASFGVASYPEHRGGKGLVEAADAALYQAKRAGKNRVVTAEQPVGRPE